MLIVADTSPINYLVLIGAIQHLPVLYHRIIIPTEVYRELQHGQAPTAVQAWAAAPPAWLEIRQPSKVDESLRLDGGEAAAVALALELNADRLLMDENRGRQVARHRGIAVAGTLTVILEAARLDLVKLPDALERLKQTNFRASPALYDEIVDRFERRSGAE